MKYNIIILLISATIYNNCMQLGTEELNAKENKSTNENAIYENLVNFKRNLTGLKKEIDSAINFYSRKNFFSNEQFDELKNKLNSIEKKFNKFKNNFTSELKNNKNTEYSKRKVKELLQTVKENLEKLQNMGESKVKNLIQENQKRQDQQKGGSYHF